MNSLREFFSGIWPRTVRRSPRRGTRLAAVELLELRTVLSPTIVGTPYGWTIEPFQSGFGLLETPSHITYGRTTYTDGVAHFPTQPLTGSVTLPVFLVDWSDFDPVTDESFRGNPNTTFPDYVQKSPEELSAFLNGTHGPAEYFREVSGGQFDIRFEVFPWMVSDQATYLEDKEPSYYYYSSSQNGWYIQTDQHAKDVLRSAIVDWNVDLRRFDADANLVLDGFAIVYEGRFGKMAGANLSWTNGGFDTARREPTLDNVATLVPATDPNYPAFAAQPLLFNRFINLPEQGPHADPETWVHELGHLFLGYTDYYKIPTDLGRYAMSAHTGAVVPFHPAAMEKWLFAHWIDAVTLESPGTWTLTNHHIKLGQTYSPDADYLYRINVGGDPLHYLTIENRYFQPKSQGGSFFNEDGGIFPIESGLVVFEINQHLGDHTQIRRLLPLAEDPNEYVAIMNRGALQPGDVLQYESGDFRLVIDSVTAPGAEVSFRLRFGSGADAPVFEPPPAPAQPEPTPPATPAPDTTGLTVVDVQRVVTPRNKLTHIVLRFSEPLDPTAATDLANYQLVRAGRDGRFNSADDRPVLFSSATYDAVVQSVTLELLKSQRAQRAVQLTASGAATIVDAAGNALDGNGDGTAGDNYVVMLGDAARSSRLTACAACDGVVLQSLDFGVRWLDTALDCLDRCRTSNQSGVEPPHSKAHGSTFASARGLGSSRVFRIDRTRVSLIDAVLADELREREH